MKSRMKMTTAIALIVIDLPIEIGLRAFLNGAGDFPAFGRYRERL